MSDAALWPAHKLAEAIRRREMSSRELLDHYLARIDSVNPAINAVVTLDQDGARRAADDADAALLRGDAVGPLHGVPITIKDTYETAGLRTTCGVEVWDHIPERDADAVRRLRDAGAVIFGKTNTPAFAGDVQTFNAIFGTTNNPWDTSRSTGGSSGGSAAALAAGPTGLELGGDIAGSIRLPSNWCGICGHKSSWGIVPHRGHLPPAPGGLATGDLAVVGPMARDIADLKIALDVLAGPAGPPAVGWRLELPPARLVVEGTAAGGVAQRSGIPRGERGRRRARIGGRRAGRRRSAAHRHAAACNAARTGGVAHGTAPPADGPRVETATPRLARGQ
jgi:amidase